MTTTLNLLWEGFHVFVNKVEKKQFQGYLGMKLSKQITKEWNFPALHIQMIFCVSSHALLIFYTVIFQVYFIAEYTRQWGKRLCLQRYL